MAEGQMMTPADVVASAMAGERGDLLRDAVALVVRELMEAEVVRHEALSDRAGCETSPPGCRSGLVKLGAAGAWSCG